MSLEYEELTKKIIKCAIKVHKTLGPGFMESIYENAMKIELNKLGLKYECQKITKIKYDSIEVGVHKLDLFVENTIVVELKTIKNIEDTHFAIVKSYIRAVNKIHGLLLNFSKKVLEIKRVISE
jgi:GxxExxY protein